MQFIKFAGLSARQFDISIGASNGYILRMQKNNASIGSDVIENIIRIYPQLNVVWLLTGEGEMLNSKKEVSFTDFNSLPRTQQLEIENIIERKIKEEKDRERERLLKDITSEIIRSQKQH